MLNSVVVAKPWGFEAWYSGIEERGESRAWAGDEPMPLSRFLARHGRTEPVILLKTLHPRRGDLYVEVHERKREVYVVQQLDPPRYGSAGVLLGARAGAVRELGEDGFRQALLEASREARRRGDAGPVAALLNAVPLRPGDAVSVPPRMPHSLLQGVHVVEFQTPVFERRILAASQPVATEPDWDGAAAAALADLSPAPPVVPANYDAVQTLAETSEFVVRRHRLRAGETLAVAPWSVAWLGRAWLHATDGVERFPPGSALLAPAPARLRAVADTEVLVASEV